MSPLHMLDTDMSSYVIRSRTEVLTQLARVPPERVCISVMTRAELLYGLKNLPAEHPLHLGVARFLEMVRCPVWDHDCADRYADIRHELTTTGRRIGEMDMLIAAHALSVGAVLVTNNVRHFSRVGALKLVNWTATRPRGED